jgi:hypothetical protein
MSVPEAPAVLVLEGVSQDLEVGLLNRHAGPGQVDVQGVRLPPVPEREADLVVKVIRRRYRLAAGQYLAELAAEVTQAARQSERVSAGLPSASRTPRNGQARWG